VNQGKPAHLDQLTALLPDLADHSPIRRLVGLEATAGQAPMALRVGLVGELRHQDSAHAGHEGVGGHALVRLGDLTFAHRQILVPT
jgi:hypothetical protein